MDKTQTLYEIPVKTIDGKDASLGDYKGDVLLVVNVASECGLTPQYAGLQKLHDEYRDRGFKVLGFPCNQFGAQEPGTNEQIAQFCSLNYDVTFPMFGKIEVNGERRHPLYSSMIGEGGDVTWNFEKFVIGRDGNVVARFSPKVTPDDPQLRGTIESSLKE